MHTTYQKPSMDALNNYNTTKECFKNIIMLLKNNPNM